MYKMCQKRLVSNCPIVLVSWFSWRYGSSDDVWRAPGMVELLWNRVFHSRQQERLIRSLYGRGMTYGLVDVSEWWKINESDQVRGGSEWGDGDRVDQKSQEYDMW